jgi:hypothetical protein
MPKLEKRMSLDHELASLDGPEPAGLPPDVIGKRRAWIAAWYHVQAMQHEYFQALNRHYNAGTLSGADLAASWYAAIIQHLSTVIARRQADGLSCELHLRELEAMYTSARMLDMFDPPAPVGAAGEVYDNADE